MTLRQRILAWQDWYEQCAPDGGFADASGFSAEGLAIAKAVKNALPAWTVVYFDEARCAELPYGSPRHLYEYEIKRDRAESDGVDAGTPEADETGFEQAEGQRRSV